RAAAPRRGAHAASPRVPGGAQGVRRHAPHLARRRRLRRGRRDRHAVRLPAVAVTRLQEVVEALRAAGQLVRAPGNIPEITGITADTRHLSPGALYCAVTGAAEDGHRFIAEAARRGAAAALVARGARGAAMEVSSHSLDQGRVDGLVFRAGIFTNLSRDHLDYHKTLDAYLAAKAKLVAYLSPDGVAVVNADDPAWNGLPNGHRRVRFSERAQADVWAEAIVATPAGSTFDLRTSAGRWPVTLPLLGRFNVANALGVAGCAIALG